MDDGGIHCGLRSHNSHALDEVWPYQASEALSGQS
jgi:hypothetical protein